MIDSLCRLNKVVIRSSLQKFCQ